MSISLIGVLHRSLDASSLRHQAISNNLANSDTPNYKPQRVHFEAALKEAMKEGLTSNSRKQFVAKLTNEKHIPFGQMPGLPIASVSEDNSIVTNENNGVDDDYEMSALSRNSIWYNALVQQTSHEFQLIQTAIKGRV